MRKMIALGAIGALAASAMAQDFSAAAAGSQSPVAKSSGNWTFGTACYVYDDGDSENSLGLIEGGDMAWLQHFDPREGCETVTQIHAAI